MLILNHAERAAAFPKHHPQVAHDALWVLVCGKVTSALVFAYVCHWP